MTFQNKNEFNCKMKGLGYLKSLNSHKDFSIDNPEVEPILKKLNLKKTVQAIQTKKDLRTQMTPVRDQQYLGSCTAFAASALVEYFMKKTYQRYTPVSTLFTYYTTRKILKLKGDTGAY
jgi:C1A family cysteine protease